MLSGWVAVWLPKLSPVPVRPEPLPIKLPAAMLLALMMVKPDMFRLVVAV